MSEHKKEHRASKVSSSIETKKNQSEEKANFVTDATDNTADQEIEENLDVDGRSVIITLELLENIKLQSPNNEIFIKASYRDILLEDSPKYRLLEECFSIETKWQLQIACFPSHRKGRDDIISNPICITIVEMTCQNEKPKDVSEEDVAVVTRKPSKSVKGKVSTKGSSIKTLSKTPILTNPFHVLGHCNLDILPLLLGATEIIEVLEVVADEPVISATEIVETADEKLGEGKVKGMGLKKKASTTGKQKLTTKNAGKSTTIDTKSSKMKSKSKNKLNKTPPLKEVPVIETVADNEIAMSEAQIFPIGPLLLTVRAKVEEPLLSAEELDNSNMLSITVESMYNLVPDLMTKTSLYQPGTVIHDEFKGGHKVKLGFGRWKTERSEYGYKRWNNLAHVDGKRSFTVQKLSEEMISKINFLGSNFSSETEDDSPRIEWNVLQRCWLSSQGSRYCKDNISKFGMWPLELIISFTPNLGLPEDNSKKKKVKSSNVTVQEEKKTHCIAFFDVKKLLYPGVKRIHAIGQVFTFCEDDIKAKCGIESPVFSLPRATEVDGGPSADKKKGKGTSLKSKSSKSSVKSEKTKKGNAAKKQPSAKNDKNSNSEVSKKKTKSNKVVENRLTVADEANALDIAKCAPQPLYLEPGKPVFVILELEFWKPLTKKRTHDVLFKEIDKMIPKTHDLPADKTATKKEHKEFVECIQAQAAILNKEYHKFLKDHVHISTPTNSKCDLSKDFILYLCGKGTHQILKSNLCEKVGLLFANKPDFKKYYGGSSENFQNAKRNYVSHMYTLLIEEMHTAINNLYDGREATDDNEAYQLTDEQLELFVKEADELQGFGSAEKLHMLRTEPGKSNHKSLLDYAIFCTGHGDMIQAEEIVLKALSLENRDKLSLLIYAVLLAQRSETKQAETVFEALMSLYPDFLFGGMTFYLFYLNLGNYTGAEVILENVNKWTSQTADQSIALLGTRSICWIPDGYSLESTFLSTAVFLMKINALDYAELALTEELRLKGPSIGYYYFLAVSYYLSERYNEAAAILKTLLKDRGRDCILRSLLGHCQYNIQNRDAAKDSYQFVSESAIRTDDIYLVNIRLGNYYLEDEEYQCAKDTFLDVCVHTPSATSWLGLGKACYMLGEFDESERALTEANILNNTCPETWGYLTLVNLELMRRHEYHQCYSRALRCNLQDEIVLNQIEELRNKREYSYPCVISEKKY